MALIDPIGAQCSSFAMGTWKFHMYDAFPLLLFCCAVILVSVGRLAVMPQSGQAQQKGKEDVVVSYFDYLSLHHFPQRLLIRRGCRRHTFVCLDVANRKSGRRGRASYDQVLLLHLWPGRLLSTIKPVYLLHPL